MTNNLSTNATVYREGYIATICVTVTQFDDLTIIDGTPYMTDDLIIGKREITSKLTDAWSVLL